MTQGWGHDPYQGPTPERPRYVLLMLTQSVNQGVTPGSAPRGRSGWTFPLRGRWENVLMPRRRPRAQSRGGHRHRTAWTARRPAPSRGAHGALAPPRPGAQVGASREAHGPDGGREPGSERDRLRSDPPFARPASTLTGSTTLGPVRMVPHSPVGQMPLGVVEVDDFDGAGKLLA